jgi:hypothetical protein
MRTSEPARARRKFFREIIEIAPTADNVEATRARLRVDTRKWAAARLAPKTYADHVTHDVKGAVAADDQEPKASVPTRKAYERRVTGGTQARSGHRHRCSASPGVARIAR